MFQMQTRANKNKIHAHCIVPACRYPCIKAEKNNSGYDSTCQHLRGKGTHNSVSLRLWSTEQVPSQPGIHTVSHKKKRKKEKKKKIRAKDEAPLLCNCVARTSSGSHLPNPVSIYGLYSLVHPNVVFFYC